MKAVQEGEGSLLDNSIVYFSSEVEDGNAHRHKNLPVLVAGRGGGQITPGRHIQYDKPTPLANLHLSLLNKVGVPMESFADSTGTVDELFEPLSI